MLPAEKERRAERKEARGERLAPGRRTLAVLLLLILPAQLLFRVESLTAVLWGAALLVIGVVLFAPDLAGFSAGLLTGILWPSSHADETRPMYGIPESHAAAHRYPEACEAYEDIIRDYPQEAKPYVELIKIAFLHHRDEGMARSYLDRAAATLRDPDSIGRVQKVFDALAADHHHVKPPPRVVAYHASTREHELPKDHVPD